MHHDVSSIAAQLVPDSGGGVRTLADVWPLLVVALLFGLVLVRVMVRFAVLMTVAARGKLREPRQKIELAGLAVAVGGMVASVAWLAREMWLP